MKKLLSIILCFSMVLFLPNNQVKAKASAEIKTNNISILNGACKSDEIKEDLQKVVDGNLSKSKFESKYSSNIYSMDVYAEDIKDIEDIYGVQLGVSASGNNFFFYDIKTDLQSGMNIGDSLWEAYLSYTDNKFNKAKILLYGTEAITAPINKTHNYVGEDKYKIATIRFLVGKDAEEITLSISTEDIASKNEAGKVSSSTKDFKFNTESKIYIKSLEKDIYISMLGAQIKVDGTNGLRFGTRVEKKGIIEEYDDISFGTLIIPTNLLKGKELTHKTSSKYIDCKGEIYEDKNKYFVFTGEITNLKDNYSNVNFTARAYIKVKEKGEDKYSVYYSDAIVRNIANIKNTLGISKHD